VFYDKFEELVEYTKNKNKKIYYDSTTELISEEFIEKIERYTDLSQLNIFTNGPTETHKDRFYNLEKKGVTLFVEQYFVKYCNYYVPIKISNEKKRRCFLLLGGKSKSFRTALTGLIYHNNLEEHGHISYFGFEPHNNFSDESVFDYFMSDSPIEQKLKVKDGLHKMGGNKYLDVEGFDHQTSHTRLYDSTYYDLVDFVVIMESDIAENRVFITEKTTKCVQMNKKFILLSSCGMLEKTKEYYKKYHDLDISHLTDWCDNSYDKITNVWDRIDTISELIKKHIQIKLI
jgi:hypothetical protein